MDAVEQHQRAIVAADCTITKHHGVLATGDVRHRRKLVTRRKHSTVVPYRPRPQTVAYELDEGPPDPEVRGRNRNARSRTETGVAQGDQAGARAGRSP